MKIKTSFYLDEGVMEQARRAAQQWAKRERAEASPERMTSSWVSVVLRAAAAAELEAAQVAERRAWCSARLNELGDVGLHQGAVESFLDMVAGLPSIRREDGEVEFRLPGQALTLAQLANYGRDGLGPLARSSYLFRHPKNAGNSELGREGGAG